MSNDHVHPAFAQALAAVSGDKARQARCSCFKTRPTSEHERLAFFENRGPGSDFARITCRHCRYHDIAHTPQIQAKNPHICAKFEPLAEGHEFDAYYCGCRGWD